MIHRFTVNKYLYIQSWVKFYTAFFFEIVEIT